MSTGNVGRRVSSGGGFVDTGGGSVGSGDGTDVGGRTVGIFTAGAVFDAGGMFVATGGTGVVASVLTGWGVCVELGIIPGVAWVSSISCAITSVAGAAAIWVCKYCKVGSNP